MASAQKREATTKSTPARHETTAAENEAPVSRDPVVPKVLLAEGHQALCLVEVGDAMPDITLPDLEGNDTPLASLYGETLTVVFFWAADRALARSELADLSPDVAVPYSGRGVKVVGIAVGETAESAQKHVTEAGATFPNLLDADGSAMAKVGSEKLPRTYLLDAQGKILWFDIEYSRSTRRELREAIQFVLGEK
jgi:peroxiredoxin